jgi:hypothetical protein
MRSESVSAAMILTPSEGQESRILMASCWIGSIGLVEIGADFLVIRVLFLVDIYFGLLGGSESDLSVAFNHPTLLW